MKKSFTTIKTQIVELEDQSNISDRDESDLIFLKVVYTRSTVLKDKQNNLLNKKLETRSGALTNPLNLREVFLLDNQLNVDLACIRELAEDIQKSKYWMQDWWHWRDNTSYAQSQPKRIQPQVLV